MENIIIEVIKAIAIILAAVLGAGGIAAKRMEKWMGRRIEEEKGESALREQQQKKRYVLERKMRRATGRWMFWVTRGTEEFKKDTGKMYWNGEVQKAHDEYIAAEEAYKEIDSEQLSEHLKE